MLDEGGNWAQDGEERGLRKPFVLHPLTESPLLCARHISGHWGVKMSPGDAPLRSSPPRGGADLCPAGILWEDMLGNLGSPGKDAVCSFSVLILSGFTFCFIFS